MGGTWVPFEREEDGSAELLRFKNNTRGIKWLPNSITVKVKQHLLHHKERHPDVTEYLCCSQHVHKQ